MTDCEKYLELIQKELDGEAAPEEVRTLAEHLAACPACRGEAELIRGANAAFFAVGVPAVSDEEWFARAADLETKIPILEPQVAQAVLPPDVSREEWGRVWQDIERRALLDGTGVSEEFDAMRKSERRRVLTRRLVSSVAVAAALVLVVLAAYYLFSPRPPGPPQMKPDTVTTGPGYLYRSIDMGDGKVLHEIAFQDDIVGAAEVKTGQGYLFSSRRAGDGTEVIEITSEEDLNSGGVIIIPPPEQPAKENP